MPLCFAYGSNMDRDAMAARCPASVPFGIARLPHHRFVIMPEGYASVEHAPRDVVWGLVWTLALADGPALDRYEGVAQGLYRKAFLPVLTSSGPRRALVYLGRSGGGGRARPGYMEGVLAAAIACGLPDAYCRVLSGFVTSAPTRSDIQSRLCPAPAVTPTRRSPLDPPPDPAPWSWTP